MIETVNPRYACFCAAHGVNSEEEMGNLIATSISKNLIKPMFPIWNEVHIKEFFRQSTYSHFKSGTLIDEVDHALYDTWLKSKYPYWVNSYYADAKNKKPEIELLERAKEVFSLGKKCGMVGASRDNVYVVLEELIALIDPRNIVSETVYVNLNEDGTLGEMEHERRDAQNICDINGKTFKAAITLLEQV